MTSDDLFLSYIALLKLLSVLRLNAMAFKALKSFNDEAYNRMYYTFVYSGAAKRFGGGGPPWRPQALLLIQ